MKNPGITRVPTPHDDHYFEVFKHYSKPDDLGGIAMRRSILRDQMDGQDRADVASFARLTGYDCPCIIRVINPPLNIETWHLSAIDEDECFYACYECPMCDGTGKKKRS